MKKEKVYNINNFNFYRRKAKYIDLDRAFNRLIEEEEEKRKEKGIFNQKEKELSNLNYKAVNKELKHNSDFSNTSIKIDKNSKYIDINLIYPKNSIERIMKIRDLFLEFDPNKNRTFNADEIFVMFNTNKIPITREEIKDLFGFNNHKKLINFLDFIEITNNESFSNKFKKLMMEKIRYRMNVTDICPNDFNDMLSYLCELKKQSPLIKDKNKERPSKIIKKVEESPIKNMDNSNENQILDSFRRKSISRKSIITHILENLSKSKMNINNMDFNNEKALNEIRESTNLLKKEKEFKNFMEINEKKFLRLNYFLGKSNVKERILKRKEEVSKSLKSLDNININKYFCYYPTENSFKNLKNDTIISFTNTKNSKSKLPPINHYNAKKDLSDDNRNINGNIKNGYNKFNKSNLTRLLKNNIYKSQIKHKRIKERIREKEYALILENLSLNNIDLPPIQSISDTKNNNDNKIREYTENTFVTTSLNSNLNKLKNQL